MKVPGVRTTLFSHVAFEAGGLGLAQINDNHTDDHTIDHIGEQDAERVVGDSYKWSPDGNALIGHWAASG